MLTHLHPVLLRLRVCAAITHHQTRLVWTKARAADEAKVLKTFSPSAYKLLHSPVSPQQPEATHWKQLVKQATYPERFVLLNEETAKQISSKIHDTSRRNEATTFFDADGGACMVTESLLERGTFQRAKVFTNLKESQVLLKNAWKRLLKKHGESISQIDINFNTLTPLHIEHKGAMLYMIGNEIDTTTPWQAPAPNTTLFATCTNATLKYIVLNCLYHKDFRTEFYKGRPEFYFLVTPLTYVRMTSRPGSQFFSGHSALFQVTMNQELLATFPREHFFPWSRRKLRRIDQRVEQESELAGQMVLMRCEPKVELEFDVEPMFLRYFCYVMYRRKSDRMVELLEKILPGVGLDYVRQGYDLYETIREVPVTRIPEIVHILASHKRFRTSNFTESAQDFEVNYFAYSGGDSEAIAAARKDRHRTAFANPFMKF